MKYILVIIVFVLMLTSSCGSDKLRETDIINENEGVHRVDLGKMVSDNKELVEQINQLDFEEHKYVTLQQNFMVREQRRLFVAFKDDNYSYKLGYNIEYDETLIGTVAISLTRLTKTGSGEVQVYEIVTNSEYNAIAFEVDGEPVDGVLGVSF